ncbi:uncharacterized protein MONOS_2368 [Monocercomonoides exilis]|uniref:uncharacterized protein n=1 Tax=Monocercomonoides exilis TaxID=2049356 RepID=UPI003559FBEC|nr:hypothetical protein MONOS_2368 [Monocercomonoides exilis]|eukprot:MONOS_2368.1-p1 / transcript=MONOS_2368.1 / gene=MONOS_2368 / organism=Monocercomonoides_exilis_PA203 / gene_product=unspecified product / transcript_product=unspecified product / location=Mono_scaffold00048:146645-148453(-) / protein_length=531 / sequence_SO=supercontig / SO=protein_coding / is_pseudo=false
MSDTKVESQTLPPEGQTSDEVNDISIQQQQQLQAQVDQIQTQTAPSLAASMAYLTYAGGEAGAQVLAGQTGQQIAMQQMMQPGMQYQTAAAPTQMWQMQMMPQTIDQSRMAQPESAPQPEPSAQSAPIQSSMMEGFGIPASRIEPATQSYSYHQYQRPFNFQNPYIRGGPGSGQSDENEDLDVLLASTINQRVERYDDGDNTWEGDDAGDLLPGKHGAVIVTAGGRRYNILLVVHDSRVGSCYLLNRGETDPHASSKVNQIVVPNKYRAAVTYIHKLFISEFSNRTFAVQACEPGAPIFQGSTSTAAWTSALKYYCPQRQQPRLSGPLFFGFALKPIQDACPGLRYTARKKGNRGDRSSQLQSQMQSQAPMLAFDNPMGGWFMNQMAGFGQMGAPGGMGMAPIAGIPGMGAQNDFQQQQYAYQQMQMSIMQQQQQRVEVGEEGAVQAEKPAVEDVNADTTGKQQPAEQLQSSSADQSTTEVMNQPNAEYNGESKKSEQYQQQEEPDVKKRNPTEIDGGEGEEPDSKRQRK